jgi:broad specificity phosphatase PhoE
MRRCRETAAPLGGRWGTPATVCATVGEIPNPTGLDARDRPRWLADALAGHWPGLPAELVAWRRGVVEALLSLTGDTVVFTHFVAINVVLGWAADDDRVTVARPDNCSRTVVEVTDGRLTVVAIGHEADTEVR